jgi:hypothetical protein
MEGARPAGRCASRGGTNTFGCGLGSEPGCGKYSFADVGPTFGASGTTGPGRVTRFGSGGGRNCRAGMFGLAAAIAIAGASGTG